MHQQLSEIQAQKYPHLTNMLEQDIAQMACSSDHLKNCSKYSILVEEIDQKLECLHLEAQELNELHQAKMQSILESETKESATPVVLCSDFVSGQDHGSKLGETPTCKQNYKVRIVKNLQSVKPGIRYALVPEEKVMVLIDKLMQKLSNPSDEILYYQ